MFEHPTLDKLLQERGHEWRRLADLPEEFQIACRTVHKEYSGMEYAVMQSGNTYAVLLRDPKCPADAFGDIIADEFVIYCGPQRYQMRSRTSRGWQTYDRAGH